MQLVRMDVDFGTELKQESYEAQQWFTVVVMLAMVVPVSGQRKKD